MIEQAAMARLDALESEGAVRRLVARYFRICDVLGPDTPFAELGDLFTDDAVWEGRGRYAKAFGRYDGRAAIVDMIRGYCLPQPYFAMTGHFLSSEDITVAGDRATGGWMMLQTTDYADGRADFRSARITVRAKRAGGRWRIAHFLTENIFSRVVERWNDEAAIPVPAGQDKGASR